MDTTRSSSDIDNSALARSPVDFSDQRKQNDSINYNHSVSYVEVTNGTGYEEESEESDEDLQLMVESLTVRNESPRAVEYPPPPQHQTAEHPRYLRSQSSFDSSREEEEEEASTSQEAPETDRFGFFKHRGEPEITPKIEMAISIGTLRKRELKWIHMLDNWSLFMNKRFHKIKERCRKGIPRAIRGRAWKYLSGAAFHMQNVRSQAAFEMLDAQAGDQRWIEDIDKDLNRQFPEHELFSREGPYGRLGQGDLFRLLKAYTVLHPEEGYCQGQAPVAATLLMHMPLKDAFYVFVQICHKYLPGYYSPGLESIQMDGEILNQLLKKKHHATYKHLRKQNVDPVLYMVEWFMCIFCRTLPWSTVLRIWDMFFCEGVKVLFKVSLVLFHYSLGSRAQIKACPGMYEVVERLRNLPPQILEENFLVSKLDEVKIDEEDLERIHYKVYKRRMADNKKR